MFLEVGNRDRIADPALEQIGLHLRNLPADAPFLILSADAEHFIQATTAGEAYRVEWRQEALHRFMVVPLEVTEQAFLAFRRWDEPALVALPWRRLSVFNDRYRWLLIAVVLLSALVLVRVWLAVR